MRRLAFVVVFAAFVAVPASASAVPTPSCSPQSCSTWQQAPVTVSWSDPDNPGDDLSSCNTTLTTDSPSAAGTQVSCGSGTGNVLVDSTPPVNNGGAPTRPPDHAGWYNHPLTVGFGGSDALSMLAACSVITYSGPPGAGVRVGGNCTDNAGNVTGGLSSPFNYDSTPPLVTGAVANRPADHDGWYTHPVVLTFTGADAMSGMGPCGLVTYSGPDGANRVVHGGCQDAAGNSGQGIAHIKYDATPPNRPKVHVAPGNRRVDVSWTLPSDAVSVVVSRTRQGSSRAPVVVYSGNEASVLDKRLKNDRKYRYTVTDFDAAGNSSSKTIAAVPTASSLRPFPGTRVRQPPLLTWKRVKKATYYNIQLWRGAKKVLSAWPRQPSFEVASKWRFRGRTHRFKNGHYRWYVWPGFGRLAAHRYGDMLGRSSFRMLP